MSTGGEGSGTSLPDYVASLYYKYGIFVASNPAKVILFALASFALLSKPLWYLPFPGYLPQEYVTSINNYSVPPPAPEGGIQLSPSPTPTPLWYQGAPIAYIQQVVVRSAVTPWRKGVTVAESIRGPLCSVFHLTQIISDFQLLKNSSLTLGSECLLVEGVVRKIASSGPSLPHFNCLMLSPADLWGRDPQAFVADQDVLLTVKSLKGKHEEETSIADILFGLPSKDVGLSSNPTHPQVINYAITIALKRYSESFIFGLEEELGRKFPLHQPVDLPRQFVTHVYFPSQISLWEFLILIFYCFLFSSIYFSFLKMEGLYSRVGLAFCIMVTLVASVCLATSVSAHFGLRPLHSKAKYFYPVLSALVGFENSMVLVRSVLSSPEHLDVKIRIAQGLAKEGWTVTKYFFTMITFVTVSFFLFIPLVQEICIYGSLVLLCDLYFQLLFVIATIAVDLRRGEDTESHHSRRHLNPLFRYSHGGLQLGVRLISQDNINQTHVPNLHRRHATAPRGEDILAPPKCQPQAPVSMPKRLRLTYFVVRKRMFQRMFICTFVAWIAWMVYSSELVSHFTDPSSGNHRNRDLASVILSLTNQSKSLPFHHNGSNISSMSTNTSQSDEVTKSLKAENDEEIHFTKESLTNDKQLLHTRRSFVKHLPISHWPALFSYYNISLRGHYLSILPSILLSLPIGPEEAKLCHNPHDPHSEEWVPQFLDLQMDSSYEDWQEEFAIIPSSKGELLVTAVLVIPALVVLIYATIALYRCICSRNYAEWRSSTWNKDSSSSGTAQIIGEAVPLVLAEHPHDVECLGTDGCIVVSTCLAGVVRAWDPVTGECIASINRCSQHRTSVTSEVGASPATGECYCGMLREYGVHDSLRKRRCRNRPFSEKGNSDGRRSPFYSLTSSQSFPSLSSLPNLSPTINLDFQNSAPLGSSQPPSIRFDHIRQVYEEFELMENREEDFKRSSAQEAGLNSSYCNKYATNCKQKCQHVRNLSVGSIPQDQLPSSYGSLDYSSFMPENDNLKCSPIWCMDCEDGFVYLGTGSGTTEVWDIYSSVLKCHHDDESEIGITSLKVSGSRVVIARLNGSVDILLTEVVCTNQEFGCENGNDRGKRSSASSSDLEGWTFNLDEQLRLTRLHTIKAHQQPITILTCDINRVITGSHDHTLKVLNISDGCVLFTLHGHYGPITAVTVGGPLEGEDPSTIGIPVDFGGVGAVIASGAQDGSLCVWDLHTGTCVYSVQAHDGGVAALTCTSSYILSLGADSKLCVWERFQGHLLNTLIMGSLTVWDITAGMPVRIVRLGDKDQTIFIRHLIAVAGSVVCDYGNQLRIVRLPVVEKLD